MELREEATEVDKNKVQEILAQFQLPPEIKRIETAYGRDHSGDPAVFLTFFLREGPEPSREDVKPISEFVSRITNALYNGHVGGFAYTRLKQAA